MTGTKTVAERLKEAVKTRRRCDVDIIGNALGRAVICDSEKPCFECEAEWFNALADAIEAEQVELRSENNRLLRDSYIESEFNAMGLMAQGKGRCVDVDALLKLAQSLERMVSEYDWDAPFEVAAKTIRDAVKGAKPQLPEGVEWPRFEDGELAKPFDKLPGFDSGGVQKFIWTSSHNGAWQLQDAEGHMLNVMHGEPVKRHEPEVLDADGVPIKVGDTVYAHNAEPLIVRGQTSKDLTLIEDSNGDLWEIRSDALTHRKPDTQEAIESDATIPPRMYYAEHIGHDVGLKDDAECTEAMVLDLLRRQRKLMEAQR